MGLSTPPYSDLSVDLEWEAFQEEICVNVFEYKYFTVFIVVSSMPRALNLLNIIP